jgi:cytoskeletal protein CcmA (bactofilin family)
MFSKLTESNSAKVDTIIGKSFTYKGTLVANDGSLRIDGNFEGELRIGGDLFVGETGVVSGTIIAKNITIAGKVNGNIEANDKLELIASAKVLADTKMVSLIVEEGAFLKGLCEPQSQEEMKKRSKSGVIESSIQEPKKVV